MTKRINLKDEGYKAALAGQACDAPTTKELDRGAWEQGWRAGRREQEAAARNAALAASLKACTGAREVTVRDEPAQAAAPQEWREAADTDLSWLPEGGHGISLRAFEATLAPAIQRRRRIERRILRQIIADALAAGYTLSVDDGEEITVRKSTNAGEVLAALMTTDEDYLHLHPPVGRKSWVRLVYGNDGWDVICDYGGYGDMDALLAGALALSEKLEGEAR